MDNPNPPLLQPELHDVPAAGNDASQSHRPWGFWITIGLSVPIALAFLAAQVVVVLGYTVAWVALHGGQPPEVSEVESSGLVLSLCTILSGPLVVGLCVLFAWLRKGISVRDYLGLRWPGVRTVLLWCGVLLAMIAVGDTITVQLGRPIVPDVMIEFYETAGVVPLLWIAMMLVAPLEEEFLFRGFLFAGLRHSRLGGAGAVLITAAAWSLLHLQYDAYGIGLIFVSGLLLGYVRLRTGSVWLCCLLHALMNLVATIEVEWVLAAGK